jgi:glycosyltransferase involved in cell wall biosynthesis
MLPEFAGQAGPSFFAHRYSIGLWFWEVSRFPARWRDSFSLVEEVWAPTAHVAQALEPVAPVPVTTVRIPVAPPRPEPRPRAELGLPPDKFVFLFSFDNLSVFKRKNPLDVIDAFERAFSAGEGASLVIKCINAERDPDSHAQLQAAAAAHPDVEVIDRYLSPSDNLGLTAVCDCYVSLHRAEGLGLVMAEAMWFGKPVIATAYSGNLDFMTAENSLLVRHRLVPIGPGADPYPADGEWAEPDVEHAAALMRRVFDDRGFATELGTRAAREIRRTHSPEAAGKVMARRLDSIRASGQVRPSTDSVGARPAATAALAARLERGPVAAGTAGRRSVPGSVRRFARKGLLRLMRPATAYQHAVDVDVLAAIDELSARLDEQRRTAAGERARLLAELRRLQALEREPDRDE